MESWWEMLWPALLILICLIAWISNFFTLPGNWIAFASVLVYAVMLPELGRLSIGMFEVGAVFVLAILGEIFEFVAAAVGARRAGAGTKATVLAVVGSAVGALVGVVLGLPIPIIGSIVAALLFGAIGATVGAMFGEWMDGKSWTESLPIGNAAFWGRLLGTVGKVFAGMMILLVVCVAVLF